MDQLVDKWDYLTDAERNYIAEQMAGVRQLNTMNAIIKTWRDAKALGQDAKDNPNFLDETQDKYMERVSAKMKQTGAMMSEIWASVFQSDAVAFAVDGLNVLLAGLKGIFSAIKDIGTLWGTLSGPLAGIGQLAALGVAGNTFWGAFKGLTGLRQTMPDGTERVTSGFGNIGNGIRSQWQGTKSSIGNLFGRKTTVTEQTTEANADSAALNGVAGAADRVAASQNAMASSIARGTAALSGQSKSINGTKFRAGGLGQKVLNPKTQKTTTGKTYRITSFGQDAKTAKSKLSGTKTLKEFVNPQTGMANLAAASKKASAEVATASREMANSVSSASSEVTNSTTQMRTAVINGGQSASSAIVETEQASAGIGSRISGWWGALSGLQKCFTVATAAAAVFWGVDKAIQTWGTSTAKAEENTKNLAGTLKESRQESYNNRSTIKDLTNEWARYSKGVSAAGKNVSLTNSQFQRYQEIANQIADIAPNAVKGYDTEGNAILRYRGNIVALNEELDRVMAQDAKERIAKAADGSIQKQVDAMRGERDSWTQFTDSWNETFHGEKPLYDVGNIGNALKEVSQAYSGFRNYGSKLADLLNGKSVQVFDTKSGNEHWVQIAKGQAAALKEAYNMTSDQKWTEQMVQDAFGLNASADQVVAKVADKAFKDTGDILRGKLVDQLEMAVSGKELQSLSKETQESLQMLFSNLPNDFFLNNDVTQDVNDAADKYFDTFTKALSKDRSLQKGLNTALEAIDTGDLGKMFDSLYGEKGVMGSLKDALKGTGITEDMMLEQMGAGEIGSQLEAYNRLVDRFAYKNDKEREAHSNERKRMTREQQSNYRYNKQLNKELKKQGITLEDINNLLYDNGIETADQIGYVQDLIDKWADYANSLGMNPLLKVQAELESTYNPEMAANRVANLRDNVEAIKETRKAMNQAWTNSYSVTGMDLEDYEFMNSYAKQAGGAQYDTDQLYEKTSLGLRMNTRELRRLNQEYKTNELEKYNNEMERLKNNLFQNEEEMKNLNKYDKNYDTTKEGLKQDREAIISNMQDIESYKAIVEGMFSKVNGFFEAEKVGEAGDVYDQIQSKIKGVEELWDKGLVGTNKMHTFVDMFTNEDLSTAGPDKIVENYGKAMAKAKRYFTEGGEGAEAFLEDIQALDKGWAKLDENGRWHLDLPDEQVLAKALDVDKSLLPAIYGKLEDYGAVIDYVNETAMEKDYRLKARKNAEILSDEDKQKYKLGEYATKEVTGIDSSGNDGDLKKITDAAKNYRKELDSVTQQYQELQNAKRRGEQVDEAELQRLGHLKDALRSQIEYQDQVADQIKKRQNSYNTQEGQEKLEDQMKILKDNNKISAQFRIDWDRTGADYFQSQKQKFMAELEGQGLVVNGKVNLENVPEDQKEAIINTLHQLHMATADADLNAKFNIELSENANLSAQQAVGKIEQIKDKAAELAAYKADVKAGIEVDETKMNACQNQLKGLIESLEQDNQIELDPELKQKAIEGDFGALIKAMEVMAANADILGQIQLNGETMEVGIDAKVNKVDTSEVSNTKTEPIEVEGEVKKVTGAPTMAEGLSVPVKGEVDQVLPPPGTPLTVKADAQVEKVEGGNGKTVDVPAKAEVKQVETPNTKPIEVPVKADTSQAESDLGQLLTEREGKIVFVDNREDIEGIQFFPKECPVQFTPNSSDVENYQPGQKVAGVLMLPDGTEVEGYAVEAKDGTVVFHNNNDEVIGWIVQNKDGTVDWTDNRQFIDSYAGKPSTKLGNVTYSVNASAVNGYRPPDKYATVHYTPSGGGGGGKLMAQAQGTAHAKGTAFASGSHGDWGVKPKDAGVSLLSEKGPEIVVRGSKWFTVGERGATFFDTKPGDIIFNHRYLWL